MPAAAASSDPSATQLSITSVSTASWPASAGVQSGEHQ